MYSAFGRRLFESADSQAAAIEIKSLINKLRDRVPPFDEFRASFRQIGYTNSNSKQKNLVRYILRKFAVEGNYKFAVDFDELTIEHFEPQASVGTGEWTDETVGQLGNLFFLDPQMNGKLDTKPFAEKLRLLQVGNFSVPDPIAHASTWDTNAAAAHTDAMAEVAYNKIWKI